MHFSLALSIVAACTKESEWWDKGNPKKLHQIRILILIMHVWIHTRSQKS